MWSRKQLKDKAQSALRQNYWKAVLVCLVLIFLGSSGTTSFNFNTQTEEPTSLDWDVYSNYKYGYGIDNTDWMWSVGTIFVVLALFVIIFVLVLALALVFSAFIGNPLDLGARKFLVKNLNEKAEVKEVAYAFDSNYKNIVKVLFFRDLYLILWFMLFIVPGVVKAYEYFMIPYLLTENPNLTKEEAFALSKQMMKGQKWKTFVLNLSFIGWDLLSVCTLGILNIFYVAPYRNLTFAALFEELNAAHGYPARHIHTNMAQPYQQMNPYIQQVESTENAENHYTQE